MAVTEDYRDYVMEQLEGLGDVTGRRMFGGYGIYCDGTFFALIDNDTLYLKVDDSNRPDFEALDQKPFQPYPDKPTTMGYYTVPPEVLEDAETLHAWSRRSLKVALQAKKKKPPRRKR